jgi:hypothetical protein
MCSPDQPRDANDLFYGQALRYLVDLAETRETVEWLPTWLAPVQQSNATVKIAAQRLLRLCLTHFEADEARKTILLAAAAFRRVIKVLIMSSDAQWRQAQVLHFLDRYQAPELAWRQAVASPEGQMLAMVESGTLGATYRFVSACRGERGEFKTESAKLQVKSIWQFEKSILSAINNYPKLREERALGESHPTESSSVNYDFLGHFALCVVSSIPKWKENILQTHQAELRKLAALLGKRVPRTCASAIRIPGASEGTRVVQRRRALNVSNIPRHSEADRLQPAKRSDSMVAPERLAVYC